MNQTTSTSIDIIRSRSVSSVHPTKPEFITFVEGFDGTDEAIAEYSAGVLTELRGTYSPRLQCGFPGWDLNLELGDGFIARRSTDVGPDGGAQFNGFNLFSVHAVDGVAGRNCCAQVYFERHLKSPYRVVTFGALGEKRITRYATLAALKRGLPKLVARLSA
jgi:hypothetical protein